MGADERRVLDEPAGSFPGQIERDKRPLVVRCADESVRNERQRRDTAARQEAARVCIALRGISPHSGRTPQNRVNSTVALSRRSTAAHKAAESLLPCPVERAPDQVCDDLGALLQRLGLHPETVAAPAVIIGERVEPGVLDELVQLVRPV
jgi:hypothetical protein